PMATTLREAQQIREATRASRGLYQIGHNRRFAPVYTFARQQIQAGFVPTSANIKMNRGELRQPPWVADTRVTGGFLYESTVTLLGPSGCGKTTTLRLIAGFESPTGGYIVLDGRSLDDVSPNRRDMAMVFQSYAIFPHLNVLENIAYGLKIKKLSAAEIRRKITEVLHLTALTGLEHRAPHQLSGGQQQRVALARALVMEPKVLLFDEPLSNLDAKLREQMRAEIRRIQQALGITRGYVTHDQAEAMTLSDRIVVMNKGRIAQIGTAQQIYRR